MTKHEIMEVLEDIASSRGSEDIPLSYVEKYLDMLDEDTAVTTKDFCESIPGEKSIDIDETKLYDEAGDRKSVV